MCAVSAVMPQISDGLKPWLPVQAPFISVPTEYVPQHIRDLAKDVKDVLERLDRIDKALGLRDCAVEAAAKADFMAKLDALAQSAKEL